MKAALRIALACFSFVPLQRWLNVAGALLLLAGMAIPRMTNHPRDHMFSADFIALQGLGLLAGVPYFMGGLALRYASTSSTLHVRPHGRLSVLLGFTIAITMLAAIAVMAKAGAREPIAAAAQLWTWFLLAWGVVAATWLLEFMFGSSRLLWLPVPLLIGFVVIPVAQLDGKVFFAATAAAWLAFAAWYMRTGRVKAPEWIMDRSSMGFGPFPMPTRKSAVADRDSRAFAMQQSLLGSGVIGAAIAPAVGVAVVGSAMTFMMPAEAGSANPGSFTFILSFIAASLGYMIVRRARSLWLRAGMSRVQLFAQAERIGLQAALLSYGTGAALLLLAGIQSWQGQVLEPVLRLIGFGLLAASLFYYGFSLTRGWQVESVLAGAVLFVVFLVATILLDPRKDHEVSTLLIAIGMAAPLMPLLRWYAQRRWLSLDWRLVPLPSTHRQDIRR